MKACGTIGACCSVRLYSYECTQLISVCKYCAQAIIPMWQVHDITSSEGAQQFLLFCKSPLPFKVDRSTMAQTGNKPYCAAMSPGSLNHWDGACCVSSNHGGNLFAWLRGTCEYHGIYWFRKNLNRVNWCTDLRPSNITTCRRHRSFMLQGMSHHNTIPLGGGWGLFVLAAAFAVFACLQRCAIRMNCVPMCYMALSRQMPPYMYILSYLGDRSFSQASLTA
jgi:hypothetical protein